MRLDAPAIRTLLPHGPAMALVDRVDDLEIGRSIVASKAVTLGERCYAGVSADQPRACFMFPVSLLIESFGQAAALLWLASSARLRPGDALMLAVARECRVEGGAMPGDVLRHEARIEHATAESVLVSGTSHVGTRRVATIGSMLALIRPHEALASPAPGHGSHHPNPSTNEVPA